MPPKKDAKEVDVSQLPPLSILKCLLTFDCKKERAQKIIDQLKNKPLSFTKIISRDDIQNYAKDKGLYMDAESQQKAAKKGSKGVQEVQIPTELTPAVVAKAIIEFSQELELQGRKEKKEKQDQKAEQEAQLKAQQDEKAQPKKDVKKDAKKDSKKDAKAEKQGEEKLPEEEVKQVPEKEYAKKMDQLYYLIDVPKSQEEIAEFVKAAGELDLILNIHQKVIYFSQEEDLSLLEAKGNFEQDMEQRFDKALDNKEEEEQQPPKQEEKQKQEQEGEEQKEGEEEGQGENDQEGEKEEEKPKKQEKEVLNEQDLTFIAENKQLYQTFMKMRSSSEQASKVRSTVFKDIEYEVDPTTEDESQSTMLDTLTEDICQFSLDQQTYKDWLADKKSQPLLPSVRKQVKLEQKQKEAKLLQEQQQQALLQQQQAEQKKDDKKEAKKEAKKESKKDSKKEQADEALLQQQLKEQQEKQAKEEERLRKEKEEAAKKLAQEQFFTYNKQLSTLQLEKTGSGILLEALVDDLVKEKNQPNDQKSSKEKDEELRVDSILNNLENFVKFRAQNTMQAFTKVQNEENPDSKSTEFKQIIDECDEISKRAFCSQLFNLDKVGERERQLINKLLYPGIDRNMMPEIPEKSTQLRKAEKSQLYPFISCSVNEFERRLAITKFEDIMRETEPKKEEELEKDKSKDWNFGDRVYVERHNKNTIINTLYKAMLFEPSIITKYNEKDDNLYVIMYYKNPPGQILRKKFTADWRVLPNLENWINFFKNNENNLKNQLYYDIDYEQIGNLHERIKYMFPNDNSVMIGQKYQIGNQLFYRYKVLKEGMVFGIKQNKDGQAMFWAIFENNSTLVVELEQDKKPKAQAVVKSETQIQNLEDVKPQDQQGQPSQQSQQPQQQQQPQQGNQVQDSQLVQENQEPAEQQPKIQEKSEFIEPKASFTLTMQNGLIVKFLENGDVFQQKIEKSKTELVREFSDIINPTENNQQNSAIEVKRITTGKGSVIKYMKDGSIIVLYANGNIQYMQARSNYWITVNNKGLRKQRNIKTGEEIELDPIPAAKRTDPESGSKIIIRDDQTIIIKYKNDQLYVKHKDGTQMLTSAIGDQILVEHPDFATIKVMFDKVKQRTDTVIGMGSSFAYVGFDNLFERSNDGRILETFLPDGTKVTGYKEKKELPGYNQFQTNIIHLLFFKDESVAKIMNNGEIVIISAMDRVALNQMGEKRQENDIDYWIQMFCAPEERKTGVYTIELLKSKLWTRDNEGNYFSMSGNGEIEAKIAVSLNINSHNEDQRPQTPDIPDGEFIEEENKHLPSPLRWVPPRLFLINNDSSACEYLNQEQLNYYFKVINKGMDLKNQVTMFEDVDENNENCKTISVIRQLKSLEQDKKVFITVEIPKNLDIVPRTQQKHLKPEKQVFLFRSLLKFEEFDEGKREQFKNDLQKYDLWKKNYLQQWQNYGIQQKSEKEREEEFNIQMKIIEHRQKEYKQETYDQCYQQFKNQTGEQIENIFMLGTGSHTMHDLSKFDEQQKQQVQKEPTITSEEQEKQPSSHKIVKQEKEKDMLIQSLKLPKKLDQFAGNYFDTINGVDAFNKLLEQKLVSLNPVIVAPKIKKLTMEEISKSQEKLNLQEGSDENKLKEEQGEQAQQTLTNQGQDQVIKGSEPKTVYMKPSVFTQMEVQEEKQRQQEQEEAKLKRTKRTKEYNVYGNPRKQEQQKVVPCLLRSNPITELNQKYILTDCLTENRIKISSMHTRMYLKAPSINEMRNTGPHSNLAKTIDKKNNLDEIENKKNMMITSDLNDDLRRNLLIMPASAKFGILKEGGKYGLKITLTNEDAQSQRIIIKQPKSKYVKAQLQYPGPIPLGISRDVLVMIEANSEIQGTYVDECAIVTKHEIYKIPIQADIRSSQEYETLDKESREINKRPLLKKNVHEISPIQYRTLEQQLRDVQKVQKDPQQNQSDINQEQFMDSGQSELLPKIPNNYKEHKIDPYASFGKKKKKPEDDGDDNYSEENDNFDQQQLPQQQQLKV